MKLCVYNLAIPWVGATSLVSSVEQALRAQGYPLRWAITAVDRARGLLYVEAIVVKDTEILAQGSAIVQDGYPSVMETPLKSILS